MDRLLLGTAEILNEIQHSSAYFWAQLPLAAGPLSIFLLRSLDQAASTFRTIMTNQGRSALAWALGFVQAFFFLAAFAGLLADIDYIGNAVAFAAGYGTGGFLGITIDRWIAPGYSILRIVSRGKGESLVQVLRQQGRGVTELPGRGREGTVSVLLCTTRRRQVMTVRDSLLAIDPQAFITAEDIRVLQGGWLAH